MADELPKVLSTLGGVGISRGILVILAFLLLVGTFLFLIPGLPIIVLSWFIFSLPVWLPFALAVGFWHLWIHYVQALYLSKQKMMLLELRIPREVTKNPRAMELVFNGFNIGSGETTFIDRWWKGGMRPWWSFEMVSDGGEIHLYIWTRAFYKDTVEQLVYSQYPEVEIYEVEDYATTFPFDLEKYGMWGCDFKLSAADPLPIKTYMDYGLDQDPKEELKIDPISHLFEVLSSLKPGEQMWLQIILQNDKEKPAPDMVGFNKDSRWKADANKMIKDIREKASQKYTDKDGKEQQGYPNPTPGQIDQIKAIERSLGKIGFQVGIRGIYIAEKEKYRPIHITSLTGIYRQFGSANLNGIAPTRWLSEFSGYPWEDYKGIRQRMSKRRLFDAYRKRSWFHPPYETPHYVMTSEELATIYRFPSRAVQAPGLRRTASTKAEPPPNLPL